MRITALLALCGLILTACGGGGGGGKAANCAGNACTPTVSVAPATASVSGSVGLGATVAATAPSTIKSVQFSVDGAALGAAVTAAPYSVTWDTTTSADGFHQISATVTDSAGLTATATSVSYPVSNTPPSPWQQALFNPASQFVARCAVPRSGKDSITGAAYNDQPGSALYEKNWLRSWTNDLYLWFSEVPDTDPASVAATLDYFKVLKTSAITVSGAPKDKFHFTYSTPAWENLSQNGSQAGYGVDWAILAVTAPRKALVAFTEPGSPATAASANLVRGAALLQVDGVDFINNDTQAGVDTINAGLFPTAINQSHTFQILDFGVSNPRTITLVSANVTSTPVQNVTTLPPPNNLVGYMLFNDHLANSESELVSAFTTLQAAGVTDLVLDIRYNGGGYLDIASEVAYMIAGAGRTTNTNKTFEFTQFNSKHPNIDPITGSAIAPVPFHNVTQGFSTTANQPLPTLNLKNVYVLTGADTCSASEAIINGLNGVGVTVYQIGSTTCGKPYGFYPQDNCGTTYFSIEFQGVNAINAGNYSDGFAPQNSTTKTNSLLPGCSVADDFSQALGSPAEGRLAAALNYRSNASCPTPPTAIAANAGLQIDSRSGLMIASPLRQLRLPKAAFTRTAIK